MKYNYFLSTIILSSFLSVHAFAQSGITAIREADLKKDLYALSSDNFRGREAGTLDELKAATWLADQARAAGLKPAGDNGTYFQLFSLVRNRIQSNSTIKIGDRSFDLWKNVLIAEFSAADVTAPVVYIGRIANADTMDLRGKVVALQVSKDDANIKIAIQHRKYFDLVAWKYANALKGKGVAAIIFIADDISEDHWDGNLPELTRGSYDIEGSNNKYTQDVPYIWLHQSELNFIQTPGLILSAKVNIETFEYPSVNVVAKVDGTDSLLKKEYVIFSGHVDHDGIRMPVKGDSIYNGADDNGSVCVALLAIGRAFKKMPGKRSALFIWHGSEERGLLGSRWFASHPTVPKESIVAVLNGDMIGRNNPDSAALLGSTSPHMNSKSLVKMAMDANNEGPKFKLDTLWDKPEHPEVFYFRSDHLPYARTGIPAIYYTTLLHKDYHTPQDEAPLINYKKLAKMTEWIYRTGWKVANAKERPDLIPDFKLER